MRFGYMYSQNQISVSNNIMQEPPLRKTNACFFVAIWHATEIFVPLTPYTSYGEWFY